jgi:uncharacterized protein with GYD domain
MPGYISLFSFTPQGLQAVKGTVQRAEAVRKQAEASGGRVIGIWWLMGKYDGVIIFESPDEDTAMRFLIGNGMAGNNRTVTMRAFSEEEMARIVAGLP